jgi:UDP-GlcNAc3NAcA epimerase
MIFKIRPIKTVVTVVGARPQFIKAAVVSRAFSVHSSTVREILVHTGQHYDENMSAIFFEELDIPRPDYNLGISGGSHGHNTGRMIAGIEAVLLKENPDWVLVYGDTDSTLAGTLAAIKLHIPVAHVEAGLRSFNRRMPEEINRVLTDHAADLLFTPTDTATRNLANEGIKGERVRQLGDVMYDAALFYKNKAERPIDVCLDGEFILATIHRAENTDNSVRLTNIIRALNIIGAETPVILPLHPRTRKLLAQIHLDVRNITLLEPVGYLKMVWLLKHCKLVITDSGGLQKEAYFFGKPCITTRDETEWVELVEAKWNILVGDNVNLIVDFARSFNCDLPPVTTSNFFGQGDSAARIIESIVGI